MKFTIEFSVDAERDFELIFDHLFESYRDFGENIEEALAHAARRIDAIRRSANQLCMAPHRGTLHEDMLPGLRHIAIDRAIYWFQVHEEEGMDEGRVRVLAVFFGGQDHIRHMLARLLA